MTNFPARQFGTVWYMSVCEFMVGGYGYNFTVVLLWVQQPHGTFLTGHQRGSACRQPRGRQR